MHFLDQPRREVETTTAPGRLAQMAIDLTSAGQARGGRFPDVTVSMAIADAYEHAATIYECE
jgi:hypothetical protein